MSEATPDNVSRGDKGRKSSFWVAMPLLVFLSLAALFAYALHTGDPSKLPSTLIGKTVPQLTLAPLQGLVEAGRQVPGFSAADLSDGNVTVVNFFASWCAPCVQEHPLLVALKQSTGVRIFGVNYKDPVPGGRRFLGRFGNPYSAVGVDANGRAAIEWGVYGMPETFVVDGKGRIVFKHVGAMSNADIAKRILPAIEKARQGGS